MTNELNRLPQGDLRLLDSQIARDLLASKLPARIAYVAADGTPRVMPTWFHWTGEELVMPTFSSAPHVKREAARVSALRARPDVAATIDTEQFPPHVLLMRGKVPLQAVDGIAPELQALRSQVTWAPKPRRPIFASIVAPGPTNGAHRPPARMGRRPRLREPDARAR